MFSFGTFPVLFTFPDTADKETSINQSSNLFFAPLIDEQFSLTCFYVIAFVMLMALRCTVVIDPSFVSPLFGEDHTEFHVCYLL